MNIRPITDLLDHLGLAKPRLNLLLPNEENYSTRLFQPEGEIEASSAGVRNKNRDRASRQLETFLRDAQVARTDLVMTPEYCCPWAVLTSALRGGVQPREGEFWALGCESIVYTELLALKTSLADICDVAFEPLDGGEGKFLSPLAYVFRAPTASDAAVNKLVLAVQFKTQPMSDKQHFEVTHLHKGKTIFRIDSGENTINLLSLICADALVFLDEHARACYDRAIILHIQLNENPRHDEFRRYRDKLQNFQGDATEILCLNWARSVTISNSGSSKKWNNIAGSAWYLKPDKFDDADATLLSNHRLGLYYTYLRSARFHAVFFNYNPGVFVIETSKVFHHSVLGVSSRRRGPQLRSCHQWSDATSTWTAVGNSDDEFSKVAHYAADAQNDLTSLSRQNPLFTERLLSLASGAAGPGVDWHGPRKLDSCRIDASEVIMRITFCQDQDTKASDFRAARLRRCGELARIVKEEALPPQLKEFSEGFMLEWTPAHAQQNVRSSKGARGTFIYMGEESTEPAIEAAFKYAADNLHASSADANDSLDKKQRLAVWYREGGKLQLFAPDDLVKIDKIVGRSEVDIARTSG